jgi:hypothetical protein
MTGQDPIMDRPVLGTPRDWWLDHAAHGANRKPDGTPSPQRACALIGFTFSKRNAMVDRTAKLEAALRINAELRVQAERLIAAYVAP